MTVDDSNQPKPGYWLSGLQTDAGIPPTTSDTAYQTRVAGVTYENRQAAIAKVKVGDPILLRREPSNPYDPHAVRVETLTGEQLGYLPHHLAALLSARLDALGQPVVGIVTAMPPLQSRSCIRGVSIQFTFPFEKGEQNGQTDLDL